MIHFFKNLWFKLKFYQAKSMIIEECGEVRELNGSYYAMLTNGLFYEMRHFNKFFNVRVFYKGYCISVFKYSTDAKLLSRREQGMIGGESIMSRMNVKTTLSQILSDTPFTRCNPSAFLRLARSMASKYTSDDLLNFFFEKHYTSIGMVDYKLTIRGVDHPAFVSRHITVIDGIIYEKINTDHIPKKSLQNIHFLDTNSDLLRPFFVQKEDKFCLIYFDLKCMHMVHFIGEHQLERTSINYHTGRKVTEHEKTSARTIHQYFEDIMYDLIKIKASEAFINHCEQCGITIEDPSLISNDEMELFKMAIY